MPSRLWDDETNKREMPIGVGRGSGEQQRFVSQSTMTAVDAFPESESSLVVEVGDGTTTIAVEIRWAITQPAMRSRWVLVSCGTRKIYALECCSVEVERSGADNERLMVRRRVASCIEFIRFGFNTISTTNQRTFAPSFPPMSAGNDIMRPTFFFPFSFTSAITSTTMLSVSLILSFSSSLPHSMPCRTRVQCTRCKASSSGAPLV